MQINVAVTDANNIVCQVVPPQTEVITIDRGVVGNGIVSIVPVTISTFQYLRITYTNGTVQDVGPLTSTAYTATAPITIVGNTISLATVPIASGGTDATTAAGAIQNLLPSYTGNANKRLGLNSGGTALEWVTDGGGTVTSIAASGGSTGLTFSGSPITTSGTLTLGGTLAVASGGTGATTAADARTNLSAAYNAITISAGTGLTGGGDLTANRTLSIDSSVVTLTGTQTLTNKTLTSPIINEILDINGNEILGLSPTASATDFVTIKNGIGVGVPLHIYADGSSASIGLHIQPKGTGLVTISDGTDFNKGIRFRSSGSAASAITLLDAVSTAGRVVTLPDATTTLVGRDTTDTLTNKTIAFASNTFTGALSIANGGTGQTTANAAFNALAPSQTGNSGKYLTTDGTDTSWATNPLGTVTSVAATVPSFLSVSGSPITTSGTLAFTLSGTALPTTSGGTGLTSFTSGGVVYASSTSALTTGSALTFDASTLKLNAANTSYRGQLTIQGGSGDFSQITFYRGTTTDTDQVGYLHSSNSGSTGMVLGARNSAVIRFEVNDSERARIDTSGNFGINTSAPAEKLHVITGTTYAATFNTSISTASSTRISLGGLNAGAGGGGGTSAIGNITNHSVTAQSSLAFYTHDGSTLNEVGRFDSSGNFTLGNTSAAYIQLQPAGNVRGVHASGAGGDTILGAINGVSNGYQISVTTGNLQTYRWNTGNTQTMTLNDSGNLGIGTSSPAAKLDVTGTFNGTQAVFGNTSGRGLLIGTALNGGVNEGSSVLNARGSGNGQFLFQTDGTLRMTLNDSGNLGLGVTPSAWVVYKAYQVGWGALASYADADTAVFSNAYFDGGTWRYIGNASASQYRQLLGAHSWQTAASGTAGNAISFTQSMTLDASGNLGIGVTSPSYRFDVRGVPSNSAYSQINISGTGNARNLIYGDNSGILILSADAGNNAAGSYMGFNVDGSEKAQINSSGDLLVGTSTLASGFSTYAQIEASGTTGGVLINSGANQIGRLIFTNGNTSGAEGLIRYDGSNNSMQFWTNASERARITSSGNFGIGTSSPQAKLDVSGGSIRVNEDGGGTKIITIRSDWAGVDPAINVTTSNSLLLMTANTERARITATGALGINTSAPTRTFDVNGSAVVQGGILNTTSYYETNLSLPYFTNGVSDLAVDIRFGNLSFWGYIELEISGTYSNQNVSGKLSKLFAVGTNPGGAIYTNDPRVTDCIGAVAGGFTIGEFSWDATNSTYRIPIYHLNSLGNGLNVRVKQYSVGGGASDVFTALSVSSLYTSSAIAPISGVNFNTAIGIGGASATGSGLGITFPATQSASSNVNTLDDYEEGSWTPTWTGTISDPSITYSEQTGLYIKIGKMVYFSVRLVITASSGGSGNVRLSGLPFTSAAGGSNPGYVALNFSYGWAGTGVLSMIPFTNSTSFDCYSQYAAYNSNTQVPVSALSGATIYVIGGGCYQAAN